MTVSSAWLFLPLRDGGAALIDAADADLVSGFRFCLNPKGYVGTTPCGRGRLLHRLILGSVRGQIVDHINGDKLDNRRANLRHVSEQMNAINVHFLYATNKSGYRGVAWVERDAGWRASIGIRGRFFCIGFYSTIEYAICARAAAEIRLWGLYCPTTQNAVADLKRRGLFLEESEIGLSEGPKRALEALSALRSIEAAA